MALQYGGSYHCMQSFQCSIGCSIILSFSIFLLQRIIRFAELIFTGRINPAAFITALVCIGILLGIDFFNRFLHKKIRKIPIHIPAQLIVVSPSNSLLTLSAHA